MTSPFDTSVAPISASDEEIRAALAEAEIPPLLPALAYATGDLSLLQDDLRPDPLLLAMPQGGLTDEQLAPRPRARLRGSDPVPRRRLATGTTTLGRGPPQDRASTSWVGPRWRRTCRSSRRSWPTAARTAALRAGTRTTWHPTSTSASR